MTKTGRLILLVMLCFIVSGMNRAEAEENFQIPLVSSELLKSYDHKNPSGHFDQNCKINRLGNFGIDTRQVRSPIDWNMLTDRDYLYVGETSDEGWLVGGGEHAKLNRKDTGHAEVWRIGPDNYEQGGVPYQTAIEVMRNIQFGPLALKPVRVNHTGGGELELQFAYEPESNIGQVFQALTTVLKCPCGDYGNPFHITMARGVKFRSECAKKIYLDKMDKVVAEWQKKFPEGVIFGNGGISFFLNREEIVEEFQPKLERVPFEANALFIRTAA